MVPRYRVEYSDVLEQCDLIEIKTGRVKATGRCPGIEWIAGQLNSLEFNLARLLERIG